MLGSAVVIMLALAGASPGAPINDPVQLNIGISCRWDATCMKQQQRAMKKSLAYVGKYRPPLWRIQQCNRNASRGTAKVDWAGFNNCVRNAGLIYRPPPPPPSPARKHPRKKRGR
jgi:putative component of membrane protein insertase Oxa1/YidC/SpoIIIJ protein YidD